MELARHDNQPEVTTIDQSYLVEQRIHQEL